MRILVLLLLALLLSHATTFAQPPGNPSAHPDTLAAHYLRLSRNAQDQNHYPEAKADAQKAIESYSHADEPDSLGEALVMLWSSSSLSGMAYPDRIPLLEKAAAAFEKAGNRRRQADCLKETADLQQLVGNYSAAFLTLQNALRLYQSVNYPSLQGVYDLLCVVSFYLDESDEAVRYGLLAIRYAENTGDTSLSLCTFYNHLGNAYYNIRSFEKSLYYYTRSIEVARKYSDPDGIVRLSFNMVSLYIRWGKPWQALDSFAAIRTQYPGFFQHYALEVNEKLLAIYDRLPMPGMAANYAVLLKKGLSGNDLDPDTRAMANLSLLYHYFHLHAFGEARVFLSSYGQVARKMNIPQFIRQDLFWHFTLDSAQGNYVAAIRYFEKYKFVGDTMFNQTKSRQIEQYNALYESEKKDKHILLLQKQAQAQQDRLRHELLVSRITLGGISLAVVIIALLFYTVRTKQRSNRLLEAQRAEIDRKNQSLQQLVTEKEWLVKEIHHRVKNNLHMVVGLLASQAEYLKGREAYDAITGSQHRVQAMSLIHQKLYNTDNLSSIDMPHYVHELVDYLQSSFDTGRRIRFVVDIVKVSFPLSHSIPIGLILNEAVTNAIKYAFPGDRTGHITISMVAAAGSRFCLMIRDDGVGIPARYREQSSLGISLLEGLSQDIRGALTIINQQGTVITLTFPADDTAMTS